MPKGIKGFQKGHKGFVKKDKYKEIGKKVSKKMKEKWRKGEIKISKKFDKARRNKSDETIKKMSESLKGRISPRKGVKLSEETKGKMSKSHIGLNKGDKHPNWKGGKIIRSGYIFIYNPKHPYKDNKGYVREHRLVIEKHIGRYLTKEEVVHHINKNKKDNNIENLMLFKNDKEHQKYHSNEKFNKRSHNKSQL